MAYTAVLENSIMQKGKPATSGSKMLENFISPIDATVVTRLEDAGVTIVERAEMDEFGIRGLFKTGDGSLSCSDASQRTVQAFAAIEAVANNKADFALCNDYTGAISQAAASKGVCYIHPTYGTVSRYGLIPCVPSMDQIGIVCRIPAEGFKALNMIAGYDQKDGAMLTDKLQTKEANRPKTEAKIEAQVEPKYSEIYTQLMQILCCAELSNNISRYDGIKFGYRAKDYGSLKDLYAKTRTEAFGPECKLAAIIGAMVLSQENYTRYYDKAMRLRRLIKDSLEFNKFNVFYSQTPNTPMIVLSRLCGLPSVTTPDGTYVADVGREDALEAVSL